MTPHRRGFTLIELLIAMAALAILAALAFPSYQSHIRKARRGDAQQFAMDVAARQQQFLLDRRTYATSVTAAAADNGLAMPTPSSIALYYAVTMVANTAAPPTFLVTLTPSGIQSGDSCGTMTIDQAGVKTAGASRCW